MYSSHATLEVRNLSVRYGAVDVLRDISFVVPPQRSIALVGNNGAGKSTTMIAIAGGLTHAAAFSGEVRAGGEHFTRSGVVARRRAGISIVPEREKVFTLLTVEENLRCASRQDGTSEIRQDDVLGYFPRLAERRRTLAGNLSGGEQQMLAIGMALLGTPRFLLLDEPMLGLAVPVIEQLCQTLMAIRKTLGLSLLIAESETQWLADLADEVLIIERGVIVKTVEDNLAGRQNELRETLLGCSFEAVAV